MQDNQEQPNAPPEAEETQVLEHVCSICGEPGDDTRGALIDHPEADGFAHLVCVVVKETREREKGLRARLEAAEQKAKAAEATATKAAEPAATKAEAEPIANSDVRQCGAIKAEAEKIRKEIEAKEDELDERERELDQCRAEVEEELAQVRGMRQPLIQYRSRSRLKIAAPSAFGGIAVTLLIVLMLGFFDSRPAVEPEVREVEVVKTVKVPAPFPDVTFTFDRTKTESYKQLQILLRDHKGQLFHGQPEKLQAALDKDGNVLTLKVNEDGSTKVVAVEPARRDP